MISRFFIERPRFAFVISIVITLAGLISIFTLPVAQYPNITPSLISVTTTYPGADAKTVQEGLHALPDKGAPRDLCEQALAAQLEMICNVDFRRCAVLLQEGDTVCELALDEGTLRHGGRTAPLCEIELEYVAGGEQTFHDLAAELADQLELVPEPESKLARAMKL